jgi:hypothetical protein
MKWKGKGFGSNGIFLKELKKPIPKLGRMNGVLADIQTYHITNINVDQYHCTSIPACLMPFINILYHVKIMQLCEDKDMKLKLRGLSPRVNYTD